jgi:hypothetical protein
MAEAPEAWGTMPLEDLMALLQRTTDQLATQFQEVAIDEGAYHRKFWSHWQNLPEGLSVAAMNRECEMECKELAETVTLGTSIRESLVAKRDALVAVLSARAK